uniref:Uncharacterized protein n=1 Tax=Coccidioides posadasii RMSCC 3488 TaxID=454284 RepID=A0A0J6FLP6_COCPO|nr:hypothetical protein CPAG_07585 [Coccidioides posadasii RMSCC 3488]
MLLWDATTVILAASTLAPRSRAASSSMGALGVFRQEQPDAQGHHWSLFVAEEGKPGTVYQVTGDHTFMVYRHQPDINILNSRTFRDIHQIAELNEQKVQRVVYWVNQEPPPRAPTQAQARETCQS